MTTGNGPVRIGLVGLGNFGQLHAAVLGSLATAKIVAMCDPRADVLAEAADRHGVEGRYTSLDAMLERTDLDAVYLVTPEHLHTEHAEKVIARGLPIFLEKPLSVTSAEGDRIAASAKAAGVYLQIGFVVRFETQHAFLKRELDAGAFGDLVTLRVKRSCSRAWFATYGDRAHTVYETIIHDIDLLLWFVGQPVTKVYAVERNHTGMRYPDALVAILQFANGTVATVETSWFVPDRAPVNVLAGDWSGTIDAELSIVGTKQTANLNILKSGLELWSDDRVTQPEPGLWPEVHGRIGGALLAEDAHFLDRVATGTPSTVTSVADAVAGLRIAEALVQSAAEGREITLA